MTIDISESLEDILNQLGMTRERFQEIPFLDENKFRLTDFGNFNVLYDFSKDVFWQFVLKLGCFLQIRYDIDPRFTDSQRTFENPLWLLIENAFTRGNKSDPTKTAEIKCFYSPTGFVIIVRDQGDGFNVRDVVTKLERGERFWQDSGATFFWMQEDKVFTYSYNNKGNEACTARVRKKTR